MLLYLQWVQQGPVDFDIGANPSAEGGEDETIDDQAVRVVDIVDTFRLQVTNHLNLLYIAITITITIDIFMLNRK